MIRTRRRLVLLPALISIISRMICLSVPPMSPPAIRTPMRPSLSALVRRVLLEADDPADAGEHPLHDRAHQIASSLEDPAALAAASSEETMIGRGGNATVHSIPGEEELVLRVSRRGGFSSGEEDVLARAERVENPFGDMNVGQPLARVGGATVLLRQRGEPAGMSTSEPAFKREDRDEVYRARIEAAAQMPQSAYDRVAGDLLRANQLGYTWDPSKSNNILIDRAGGRFGLVDLSPRSPKSGYANTAGEVVSCLVGNTHASRASHLDQDLVGPRREIIRRMMLAADRVGLPRGDSPNDSSYRYSLSLAGMS